MGGWGWVGGGAEQLLAHPRSEMEKKKIKEEKRTDRKWGRGGVGDVGGTGGKGGGGDGERGFWQGGRRAECGFGTPAIA